MLSLHEDPHPMNVKDHDHKTFPEMIPKDTKGSSRSTGLPQASFKKFYSVSNTFSEDTTNMTEECDRYVVSRSISLNPQVKTIPLDGTLNVFGSYPKNLYRPVFFTLPASPDMTFPAVSYTVLLPILIEHQNSLQPQTY